MTRTAPMKPAMRPVGLTLLASAVAGVVLTLSPPAQAQPGATSLRHRCTLVDGTVHLMMENLALKHPAMVTSCEPVQVQAERLELPDLAAFNVPSRSGVRVTLVEAPRSAWWNGTRTVLGALAAPAMPDELSRLVRESSARHGLDAGLVSALMYVESRFRSDAVSPKGAVGLMQLMPATAAQYGVSSRRELLDPRTNVEVGVRHLRSLHDRYDGRVHLMLAAYNAGEGAVKRHGDRIPPYRETEDYVRQITSMVGVPAPLE